METGQNKIMEALQIAIRMEIDGKEYYLKVSQESSSELGKKLLQSLATEEDTHRQKFEEIYDAIQTAMDIENKTCDFYKSQAEKANYDAETDFYDTLATEEREHHLILLDYLRISQRPGRLVCQQRTSLSGWWLNKHRNSGGKRYAGD